MLVDIILYLCGVLVFGYIFYYLTEVVKKPRLATSNGPFKKFLVKNVPTLESKFWPTFWCVESRAQTVFGSLLRAAFLPHVNYRREIFGLADGGELALDWMEADCEPDSPLVIIVPGLTGESTAEYVRCFVMSAKNIGIRTVVFNNRGLGGLKLKTPRLYCAANCDDLFEVIEHVKKLNPTVPLGAAGVSMGGLVLGHYLVANSERAKNVFTACTMYSVPWNAEKGCVSIHKPILNYLLSKYLTQCLCEVLKDCEMFRNTAKYDFNKIMQSKTLREFDSNFTTKHFGFDNVDHYYRTASLHEKLNKVSVPLLCLNAADDPFLPLDAIPIHAAEQSTHVAIVVTARGGHIGFLDGFLPNCQDQYMARIFSEYFRSTLKCTTYEFQNTSAQMLKEYSKGRK